jgi:uroporphyrinogen-III decarboxylase
MYHLNFILSSGCDILSALLIENIDAFFETVREFYNQSSILTAGIPS